MHTNLEAERQRVAKEQEERETIAKAATEKYEKELQQEFEKRFKKAQRDLRWEKFKVNLRYRLDLIRIYRVPILILIASLVIIVPLSVDLYNKIPELTQAPNITSSFTNALVAQPIAPSKTIEPSRTPTEISVPTSTATENPTLTVTPLPTEITEVIDDKGISMVYIPAGDFVFTSFIDRDSEIYLKAFYIDKFEVTNALYKECLKARACTELYNDIYLNDSNYADHPVVYLYPYQADAFCRWRGTKLPNLSQWEKAARGTDSRIYPWGNNKENSRANLAGSFDGFTTTAPVGSFERGVSPYGVHDMVGNVEELTSEVTNNWSGGARVTIGSSWRDEGLPYDGIYDIHHNYETGETVNEYTGFRCVRDVTP